MNSNLIQEESIKSKELEDKNNEILSDDEEEDDVEDSEDDLEDDAEEEEDDAENDEQSTTPEKKKRGRKCKPKDENIDVDKVQKKRGRKPKVKEVEENEKIPKKRGRKPKEKIYSVKELPKTFFEENKNETFILHLPIQSSEKNNCNSPVPNMNNPVNYSIFNEELNNYKVNNNNLLLTQQDLLDSFIFDNEPIDNNDSRYKLFEQYGKNEKNNIEKSEMVAVKEDDESKTNKIIKKNLRNIMYEFMNANEDKTWPESTNTYCWWCCHPFNGPPCALPELYKKEKFYVSGCFCSFNCTASHNFSRNDDNMWERYSLLNLMYKKLYNQKFIKINLAPPREILKIFGGYMSIEEFRDNSLKNEKIFTIVRPPLISIIPKIEENISNSNKTTKNNFPLVNENILNKTHSNLKLKRSKPITNPNSTLQSFMDLKII